MLFDVHFLSIDKQIIRTIRVIAFTVGEAYNEAKIEYNKRNYSFKYDDMVCEIVGGMDQYGICD